MCKWFDRQRIIAEHLFQKLTADLQADDNTNLLTAENAEDADEWTDLSGMLVACSPAHKDASCTTRVHIDNYYNYTLIFNISKSLWIKIKEI